MEAEIIQLSDVNSLPGDSGSLSRQSEDQETNVNSSLSGNRDSKEGDHEIDTDSYEYDDVMLPVDRLYHTIPDVTAPTAVSSMEVRATSRSYEYDDVIPPVNVPYDTIPDVSDTTTVGYMDMRGARHIYDNDERVIPIEAAENVYGPYETIPDVTRDDIN